MKLDQRPPLYLFSLILGILLISGCAAKKENTLVNTRQEIVIPADTHKIVNKIPVDLSDFLGKPLTLEGAIQIALDNNPDSAMAVARIKHAQAMLEMTRASFMPEVGFYTEYLQGDAPSVYLFKTIDQRKYQPTDFNNPGWFENYESGLTARLNLYNSGKDVLNKKIAEVGLAIQDFDRQGVENAIIAALINTYYNCLLSKEYIAISMESVSTVKEQLRVMQVRFKAGGALKSDVLSLEVRIAQVREDLLKSRNNLEMALAGLANVMGISPDTPIELAETKVRSIPIPDNYETGVVYAMGNRAELKKAREQIRQSKMIQDLAKSEYLPKVDAMGKYYYDDPSLNYDNDRENWVVAVMLNWDIFTGFSTKASQKKAAAKFEETRAADRKNVLSVKLDVKTAYLKIAEAKARLTVAQTSVAMADESLSLVKKQYEGGSATITRYLEAELARNQARINSTSAFYDREKALADAARAMGVLRKNFKNN